ncbi:MAG: protease [Candidatus Latescibacterota bacterium]|jgi:tricorn protease|nr:MAG: protease [Candidatus Latescibacterota bacterium]
MMRFSSLCLAGLVLLGAAALAAAPLSAQPETRLLRFPAVHGDRIVFTYAGDLYTVSAAGGTARRLTSDEGYEMFARFSPDGKWLAFTGQYDGNTEVYVMPSDGGVPRRVTFTATLGRDDVSDRMGPNNIVMAWRGDDRVVYRSRQHEWNDFKGHLFEVPANGGLSTQLPLPRGGWCSFSPDGKQMAYNRVFREFRTWKRYRGGQADDIWIYDFASKTTVNVTNDPAQDVFPMWSGNKIYFLSDRDDLKKMNLYVHDLGTQETRRLTDFTEFDVKFPSLGERAIVFENGGHVYRHDLASGETKKIPISIVEDFASGRGGLRDVGKEVTNFEIAPDGARALFGARGDVFTVPAKHGNTRNLTSTPGVHERASKWSPDGKWIAFVSDASGEDELWVIAQDGSAPARQITKGGDTYKYSPVWSPDSKKLLWADKKLRLQYVDVETGKIALVDQATSWEFNAYCWSPDSKWISYARPEEKRMTTIRLYGLDGGKTIEVTDGWFESNGPVFSSDGKYLFFVSNRSFAPTYGQLEWNHIYRDLAGIYLVTLAADTKSPFEPKSDEVKTAEAGKPADADKKDKAGKKDADKKEGEEKVAVKVDADGIQSRIASLPISPSNYWGLQSAGDKLYYGRRGSRDEKAKLFVYDLGERKETELGEVNGFEISADLKKMLVSQAGSYAIVDLPSAKLDVKDRLDLSNMQVNLDRRAEWNQIYGECWRQMRDFVYDPNLHGVDWKGMRAKYEPLLPFVNNRADLTYIIGEMISELSVGHAYVGGGDYPKPERIPMGLLGARIERDAASGYYRIVEILEGQNWDQSLRSPLTEIGVTAREGDYILAIDGKPADRMTDLYEALLGKAGKQVTLRLNSSPKNEGSRETVVVPTSDESELYYFRWIQQNIEKVSKATDGRVGYVHIPDMGVSGLNAFVKYYYPQLRKDALIVDCRGNGGGNVSPQIIERLRRELAMIGISRNAAPTPDPDGMVLGPKVLLVDEFSASDGDIVAYRFKQHKLGPVIGKRTWGGVVGIRGSLPLLDGGYLNRPEFSRYDVEGKEWVMEGVGVEPDITVDNDPAREFAGIDDQLDRAIAEIRELMKKRPAVIPPPPPYPDKSR